MNKKKMFPKGILSKMPAYGDTAEMEAKDVKVHIKIFNPMGSQTWYLTEYDKPNNTFFGLCDLGYGAELGSVGLDELAEVQLPLGMTLERDCYMSEITLADAMNR